MAEAVVFNVATGILAKMGSKMFQDAGQLLGVQDELEKLQMAISGIQAHVLLGAEEQYAANPEVRDWVTQLKEAIYEAENLLDIISAKTLLRKARTDEVRAFFCVSHRLFGVKMGRKIRQVRRKIEDLAAHRDFHLAEQTDSSVTELVVGREEERREIMQLLLSNKYEDESSVAELVVGREKEKREIIQLLLSNKYEEPVATIPVVGISGLGKTTLAQMVFNADTVKQKFELMLWVSVSNEFDVKLIVARILESASREVIGNLELDVLARLLREVLRGNRFLLVLDDVRSEDEDRWYILKDLLSCGARGSRILVTTWSEMVAQVAGWGLMYELHGLADDESWLLFKKMAFPHEHVPSKSYEEVGKQIVAKCFGIPMVIKTIGRLLYNKSLSVWLSFKDEEILKNAQEVGDIRSLLKLSYNHLPSHLKTCFAYCRLFPKDHRIFVPKLINLWIAQGYVQQSNTSQHLEDMGNEIFMDLLWRSFFQDIRKDDQGNIVTCKMHDLLHDLAKMVAGVESQILNSDAESVGKQTHHVSVYIDPNSQWKVQPSLLKASDVRTFLLLNETQTRSGVVEPGCKLEKEQHRVIIANLRLLRVLDLHSSSISKVPRSITKLKCLVYLDLSENKDIKVLPESITRMQNLKILNLDNCCRLKQLPKDMKSLVNLIRLCIENCSDLTHMPRGIGGLTSLSTLSRFVMAIDGSISSNSGKLGELCALNGLRGTLKIYNLTHGQNVISDYKEANLGGKQHLRTLRLEWSDGDEDDNDDAADDPVGDKLALEALQPHLNLEQLELREYRGLEFPSWLSSLTNLVAISLESCENCQCLPPLHQFSHLKHLTINGLPALEYVDDEENCGIEIRRYESFFPSLENLVLSDCPRLKGWWKRPVTSMPLFPALKSLKFSNVSMRTLMEMLKVMIVPVEQSASTSSGSSYSSSSSSPLSQLQSFEIEAVDDLEFFEEDLLQNLTSLKALQVSSCRRLKTLTQAIQHLTSLTTLSVETCKELDLSDGDKEDNGVQWQGPRSLLSLTFDRIPKLASLPKWIQHLTLLQRFEISGCRNLQSLPEWMTKLSAMQLLTITSCPQLSKRCTKERGEDWKSISHIPNIIIAHTTLQGNMIH